MTNFLKLIRRDFRSISFSIKLIVLVIFLRSMGWGFIDPYFSIYLRSFTEDYILLGILGSLISFSSLLVFVPLIRLGDKVKDVIFVRDGEFLYFFVMMTFIIAGFSKSVSLLVVSLFFSGIAQSLILFGTQAYVRKHSKQKASPFGLLIGFDNLGWIIGMMAGAWLFSFYGLNWMFLFVLPSIIAGLVIIPHIHERGIRSILRGVKKYFHSKQDIRDLVSNCKEYDHKTFFFFLLAFFDGVLILFMYIFVPLYALDSGMSYKDIAILMAVMYIPFIFSYFVSGLEDHLRKMYVIAFGLFVAGISFFFLYFITDSNYLIVFAAVISLSMTIVRPAYNGAITRLTPRGKMGEMTGLNNFIERIGRVTGPVLAGLIATNFGLSMNFLILSAFAFVLGTVSLFLKGYDLIVSYSE